MSPTMRIGASVGLALTLASSAWSAEPKSAEPQKEEPKKEAPPATVTAGLGKGVTIRSKDDSFSLNIRARMQGRFEYVAEDGEESETRFMIRRARLVFQGHALTPKLTYYLQLGFSNLDTEADLRLPLRDAYVAWAPLRDLAVRGGQMKVPFGRQRVTSSSSLEFADRSIIISELSLDRDVGVVAFSKNFLGLGDRFGYQLGVFGGDGRNRVAEHEGALWVARLDFWPNGHFDDFSEADFARSPKPRVAASITAAYNQNSYRQRSTIGDTYKLDGFDYLHGAADVMIKWRGMTAQFEAQLRSSDVDSHTGTVSGQTITEYSRSGGGFFLQLSQMLTDHLQIAGRYSHLAPLKQTDPGFRSQNEVGGSTSWYFKEHALKLQADYFYLFGSDPEIGRHQFRVQGQLYF